jgi:hypothetical protein
VTYQCGKGPLRKSRHRYDDDYLTEIGYEITDLILLVQQWALVSMVNIQVP